MAAAVGSGGGRAVGGATGWWLPAAHFQLRVSGRPCHRTVNRSLHLNLFFTNISFFIISERRIVL